LKLAKLLRMPVSEGECIMAPPKDVDFFIRDDDLLSLAAVWGDTLPISMPTSSGDRCVFSFFMLGLRSKPALSFMLGLRSKPASSGDSCAFSLVFGLRRGRGRSLEFGLLALLPHDSFLVPCVEFRRSGSGGLEASVGLT